MKKLFIITIFFIIYSKVFAQKDIELKLLAPISNQKVYVNESFVFTYSLKNVGTDWINFDDSLFVSVKFNGDYIIGDFDKRLQPHSNIPPGDSIFYTNELTITYLPEKQPFLYCFELFTSKNGVVIDSNFSNNEGCASIMVLDRNTTGIANNTNNSQDILLYPNPAISSINIKTKNPTANKAIITDVSGREVTILKIENGITNLDVSLLQNGLYFCQLFDAEKQYISRTKFTVSH